MKPDRTSFVISIMSQDRVGIVHQVASAISQLEGDIEDIRQSVLRGYFTMILFATFPPGITAGAVRRTLQEDSDPGDSALEIAIRPALPAPLTAEDSGQVYVLTASGKDRIGFVSMVSSFCVVQNLNILDLSTTVAGNEYIMILMVDVSRCHNFDALHENLAHFSRETGLNMVLQHDDIFRAVNEISRL